MTDRDDDPVAPEDVKPTEAPSDIYAEDGSVRSDFLTMVGAAIADRDLLFLRKNGAAARIGTWRPPGIHPA